MTAPGQHGDARGDEPAPSDAALAPRATRRRVLLAVVAVAAVAAAAAVSWPTSVPAGTLGHVSAPPGLVADGPLPSGDLVLAWEHVPPGTDGGSVAPPAQADDPTALGDGLALVEQLVVDTSSGETVGALPEGPPPAGVGGGEVAILVDGERLTHDVRTGALVDRVPLRGASGTPPFVFGALPDGTLVARAPGEGSFGSVLVGRDGAVRPAIPPTTVEDLLGTAVAGEDVVWNAVRVGSVFVLEVFPVNGESGADEPPPRHVVGVATGEPLGQLPDERTGPAVLLPVGDGVATVIDERVLWALGPDGAVTEFDLVGRDEGGSIRLLGTIEDRLVLARRAESGTWLVQHVAGPPWPSGTADVATIGMVDPAPRSQRSVPSMTSPPGIVEVNDVTVTGDLVVAIDDNGATVVARDLDGNERWRRPAVDGALLSASGDLVLITEPSLSGTRATLLDGDGQEVWSDVTSGPRFAHGPLLVDGHAVYTQATFPLDAMTGEPIADRGPQAPEPDEVPLAVVDDPDGIGAGVLASRRTGGADGTQVVTIGDDVVAEFADGEFSSDLLAGIVDGVVLVLERRVPSGDRAGVARMTETSVLVQPDGTRLEADGTFAISYGLRSPEVAGIAVANREDGTALLDPTTGQPRFVLPERVTLTPAGQGRLVAQQRSGWWVVDEADGSTVGELREELVHSFAVGDGFVGVAGVDGSLGVVRTADGQEVWRRDAAIIAPTALAFTGDILLVGTRDGRVIEHDSAGRVVRVTDVGNGPVTSIAAAAGTLVVGVDDVIRGYRTDGDGLTSRDQVTVP